MKHKALRLLLCLLLIGVCLMPAALSASAADKLYKDVNRDIERRYDYLDQKTGNRVCLIDEEKLIEKPATLTEKMKRLVGDGTVILWTCSVPQDDENAQVDKWQDGDFAKDSIVIVLNTQESYLNSYASGAISRAVPTKQLQEINDNIIEYANAGDYDACAAEGFSQVYQAIHPDTSEPIPTPGTTKQGSGSAKQGSGSALYTNPETGFEVMILDDLGLLSDVEKVQLLEDMIPITEFGHIMFWSTEENTYDSEAQAREKRASYYGRQSAGILLINMKTRKVVFHSDGAINSYVDASYARSITDNASGYASSGQYYECAREVYDEVYRVLNGQRIAEPMKYTSFIVIALMLAFVIVVGLAFSVFNPLRRKNKNPEILVSSNKLVKGTPSIKKTGSHTRGWVSVTLHILFFILEIFLDSLGGSSGGGSSRGGGGSSGGGGGGSSSGGSGGSSSF